MKKLILTALVLAGLTAGVMAQGYFQLDGNNIANGVAINTAGNYLATGPFNFEVWEANVGSVPAGINLAPAPGAGVLAYNTLTATGSGFLQEPAPVFTFGGGVISMANAYKMPDVAPAGASVVVAVAGWNTAATSWNAMLAGANASTRAGVLAWVQPTGNYKATPLPLAPGNAWPNNDLVLTQVPEPGTFALAGLGAAALLIFRRRK